MNSEASPCEAVGVCLLLGEMLSDELRRHAEQCTNCRSAAEFSRGLHGALGAGAKWAKGDVVLEQYEILEELGRGGQGAVYKARDQESGYIFALKVVALTPEAVEEFRNGSIIAHPNVCRINHTKSAGPFRVTVMEYVRGGSLHERLLRGPIPTDEALRIFRGICEGVGAAHARDVLHLDLKPGNVLLRDGIEPVVCDFGLATTSGAAPRGGTAGYMAPEQVRGDRLGPCTDVYALGVILRRLVPTPSRALGRLIDEACADDPARRLPTVSALLAGLDRSERRRAPPALIVVASLVVVGVAVGLSWASRDASPIAASSAPSSAPSRGLAVTTENSLMRAPMSASSTPINEAGVTPEARASAVSRPEAGTQPDGGERRVAPVEQGAPSTSSAIAAPASPPSASTQTKACCDALAELTKKYPQPNVLNAASACSSLSRAGYGANVASIVENNLSCRGLPQPCDPIPVPAQCR